MDDVVVKNSHEVDASADGDAIEEDKLVEGDLVRVMTLVECVDEMHSHLRDYVHLGDC